MSQPYDSLLVMSFGGPERPEDVMPFLRNVLRGKPVPESRIREVAEHYQHFGGISPINAQNRALIVALRNALHREGPDLPIYWGNRNWHPLLSDTLRQMREDGRRRCLAFVTSAYSSFSGCRQYLEDFQHSRDEVGPGAPQIDKLRTFYNHPGFIISMVDRVKEAFAQLPDEARSSARLVFSAHSIPVAMAAGCDYVQQLEESCRLIAAAFPGKPWKLVFQSRSGPPTQPWLEPDVCDFLKELHLQDKAADAQTVVVLVPVGFISDHMEVIYDLDTEARELCDELGVLMLRAKTAGTHPAFINMIRELVAERCLGAERKSIGQYGAHHDICPADCCTYERPKRPAAVHSEPT